MECRESIRDRHLSWSVANLFATVLADFVCDSLTRSGLIAALVHRPDLYLRTVIAQQLSQITHLHPQQIEFFWRKRPATGIHQAFARNRFAEVRYQERE